MAEPESTCWTVIEKAAAGNAAERELFARRYAPVIGAYLSARWRSSPRRQDLDDAIQEVFVECFRQGGVLAKADPRQTGGFRAFLYGVVRNVALRAESRGARGKERQSADSADLQDIADSEPSLSLAFDRAWAKALVRETAQKQAELAQPQGEAAQRRVEILRLRFQEELPIREIAKRWGVDPAVLHHEYAKARQEFKEALFEVVAFHHPGSPAEVEEQCKQLLELLG